MKARKTAMILVGLMAAVAAFAQPKALQKKVPVMPAVRTVTPTSDSIVIKGSYVQDTVPVRLARIVAEGYIQMQPARLVQRTFVTAQGAKLQPENIALIDGAGKAIKPEEIWDIKQ